MEIKATKIYVGIKQKAVLDFVSDYMNRIGFAPTQIEVAKALRIKRSLVLYHLNELEAKGLIKRAGSSNRNIKVIHSQ